MLPTAAITYFRQVCSEHITDLNVQFTSTKRAFDQRNVNDRGRGYAARLATLYDERLQATGTVILQAMKTVHARFSLPSDDAMTRELTSLARTSLGEHIDALRGSYARQLGTDGHDAAGLFKYQAALTQASVINGISKHLWILHNVPMQKGTQTLPTMTFNGPVGAVQTGPGAVAHVSQTWTGENAASLLAALQQLKLQVESAVGVPPERRGDLVSDIVCATAELARPQPNSGRLLAWLGGVAAVVQTVGSLQPAWESVKVGLAAIGLTI